MTQVVRSPQNLFLFGEHLKKWNLLDRENWDRLNIPDHLEDQVFSILVARTPVLHLFEITVSEQCPKDTYTQLARCFRALKLDMLLVCVTHARNAGMHLIFWRRATADTFHHLDVDPLNLSRFDHEVVHTLKKPTPRRLESLFEMMEGQQLAHSFFKTLRAHLLKVPCKQITQYHGLVDLVLKMVFLIFVQRKGWLNFEPRYLETKMLWCSSRNLSIVNCFLKPLFARLEGLPIAEMFDLGRLPILGGGLFDFHPEQLPTVENKWVREVYYSLVSRYSFSLFEARADRNIVGVSPEILGHVFENLLRDQERKAQGTFFTPLHVAERQVEEAFNSWTRNQTRVSLRKIRILDPSCGSGTYLVAAFNVLLRQRLAKSPLAERYNGKLFNLKRTIVQENLFGVDINPMAIRLTEVRLWLNMIQDLEIPDPTMAPALPNLQHHLRPGDFLASRLPDGDMRKWPKYELLERLRRHFPSSGSAKRNLILANIHRLEQELVSWLESQQLAQAHQAVKEKAAQQPLPGHDKAPLPVMPKLERCQSLHVAFSEVMLEKGFDLILGNPPWLRSGQLSKAQKHSILSHLRPPAGLVLKGQVDLSLYFLVGCLKLLKRGGHLGFLLPGKILQARYASTVRAWLLARTRVDYVLDYGIDQDLIFKADTFPVAIGITMTPPNPEDPVVVEQHGHGIYRHFKIKQHQLADRSGAWIVSRNHHSHMVDWPRLGDGALRVRRGIVTHNKLKFTFTGHPSWIDTDNLKPLVRGRDLNQEGVHAGSWIYWPFHLGGSWFLKISDRERDWLSRGNDLQWRDQIAWLPYRPRSFGPWLIIWKYLASSWQVCLTRGGDWVPDQTTYYITFECFETAYRYFAWFHSKTANDFLKSLAERAKDRCFFYYAHTIHQLPIPPDIMTRPLRIPKIRNQIKPAEGKGIWPENYRKSH